MKPAAVGWFFLFFLFSVRISLSYLDTVGKHHLSAVFRWCGKKDWSGNAFRDSDAMLTLYSACILQEQVFLTFDTCSLYYETKRPLFLFFFLLTGDLDFSQWFGYRLGENWDNDESLRPLSLCTSVKPIKNNSWKDNSYISACWFRP